MRQGRIHFLITQGKPEEDAADFQYKKLKSDTYLTIAKRNHPLANKKLSAIDFQNADHIVFASNNRSTTPYEKHLMSQNINLDKTVEASSAFVGIFIALESEALVTLPKTTIDIIKKYIPISEIKQPFPELLVSNYLVWHKSHDRDECHEWVREKLIELGTETNKKASK